MTNTDTRDVKSTLAQIRALADAGCQIARCAVPDSEAAQALREIRRASPLPLVADIHFDHRLALEAIECGADKVRINPGNIGGREAVGAVARKAKERGVPIRVGVNSGSIEKALREKHGGATAAAAAESALSHIAMMESLGFEDIVVSIKLTDLRANLEAHSIVAAKTPYPFHIGVTEAGVGESGRVKSAIGVGALLLRGIGDTLRVSLTGAPEAEVGLALEILRSLGLREGLIQVVSCPTCGRCRVSLEPIARSVQEAARRAEKRLAGAAGAGRRPLTLAVMGCAVNGPGEAADADMGVACGDGKGAIFMGGRIVKTVDEADIAEELSKLLEETYYGYNT
jgi:(E)-4-hydroxy-3-methylbut-2-enyl-diphosphate synthase